MKSKNNPEESGAKPAMTERKMSLQNVRFCSLLAIFATAIIFFCFLYFIGEIRSFVYSIFVFCGLVSALIIFRRKTPNVVRSIFTSIVVGLSLFFLLNFTFTDGTPTEVYEGHFVSKFHGISTDRGGDHDYYQAIYEADNGRRENIGISEGEYYEDRIAPKMIMFEQHGLFGLRVDRAPAGLPARLAWLCFSLNFFWLAAIFAYQRRNMDFKARYTAFALLVMLIASILLVFRPSTAVYVLNILLSVLLCAIGVCLALNFWFTRESRIEIAILKRKHSETSKGNATFYLLWFSLESGYEFAYESFRKEYESALEGDRMPVTVARGCLGMRILKNI